jgi:hypothetical protein
MDSEINKMCQQKITTVMLVVVGDLIGAGSAQEQAVVGETPNLAARLQGVAEPNTVIIAESTRKLLGNLFELQDLGAKAIWGDECPTRTFGRSNAGKQSAVTSDSFSLRASLVICRAADGNGRRSCIGPTTAGNCRETSRSRA